MALADEICAAVNRCSRENVSNTPDFILAEYMQACLVAFETASMRREEWYGRHLGINTDARLKIVDSQVLLTTGQSKAQG